MYKNWAAPSAEVTLNMKVSVASIEENPQPQLDVTVLKIRIIEKLAGNGFSQGDRKPQQDETNH